MTSGFSASVSGIQASFLRQDVNSNNVANINTTGFKSSRPSQVSNEVAGTDISGVRTDFRQGPLLPTGRSQDVAIEGDGFFVVEKNGQQRFTRSGSFTLDADGNLVNQATGGTVQGLSDEGTTDITLSPEDRSMGPRATDQVGISGNLSTDLEVGESRNVSVELTNSRGTGQTAVFEFERTGTDTFSVTSSDPSTNKQSLKAQLTFDSRGEVESVDIDKSPNSGGSFEGLFVTGAEGASPIKVKSSELDFSNVTLQGGDTSVQPSRVNGRKAGDLTSLSFNRNGDVVGQFSNGERRTFGQLAVANFNNPDGLSGQGNSLLSQSSNSGSPQLGVPGTGGRGELRSGFLEASNVDMAREFGQLITNQSSLDANVNALQVRQEMFGSLLDITR